MVAADAGALLELRTRGDRRHLTSSASWRGCSVTGVRPLHFEEALFEAILAGWARQQRARMLAPSTIGPRERLVRRLQAHAGCVAVGVAGGASGGVDRGSVVAAVAAVTSRRFASIRSRSGCSASTCCDRRYPWVAICSERLGASPQQIVDERNLIVHVGGVRGHPGRRPLSREELQAFFDHCDAQVSAAARSSARARWRRSATPHCSRRSTRGGCAARRPRSWMSSISRATRKPGVRRASGR